MTWLCSHKAGWSALLPGLLFAAGPADAAGVDAPRPSLSMPVDCDMAALCSIQKYYDRAPGPERLDYRCGSITTDGHDGLDIRLRAMPDIARNIPVIAAADGVVLRVRDGMADANVRATGSGAIGDRLAGNAVVIDHGHGWVTQYSHLKNGSVAVAPGRTVKADQRIGAIGMSGNAEFAHLHFEVRHDGQAVDPFAPGTATGCAAGAAGAASMWSAAAMRQLAYRSADVLAAGFAIDPQNALAMRHRLDRPAGYTDPPGLLLWGTATGARDGDEQQFTITGPTGEMLLDRAVRVAKGGLDWAGFAGVRRPAAGWRTGRYEGRYTLKRGGKNIASQTAIILLD